MQELFTRLRAVCPTHPERAVEGPELSGMGCGLRHPDRTRTCY